MMSVRSLDELAHAVQFVRTGETFVGPRREERVEVAVGLLHCGGELSDGLGKVETARPAGGLEPLKTSESANHQPRRGPSRLCRLSMAPCSSSRDSRSGEVTSRTRCQREPTTPRWVATSLRRL